MHKGEKMTCMCNHKRDDMCGCHRIDFKDAVEKILIKHGDLFKSLSKYDTLEYDTAQWMLQNKDELRAKLPKYEEVSPESLKSLYLAQYEEEALRIIRAEVTEAFKLDAENSLRIDKETVKILTGDLLKPEMENL